MTPKNRYYYRSSGCNLFGVADACYLYYCDYTDTCSHLLTNYDMACVKYELFSLVHVMLVCVMWLVKQLKYCNTKQF